MTRSLRLRLTLAVVIVLAAVLATFAVVVHLVLEQALVRQHRGEDDHHRQGQPQAQGSGHGASPSE